MLDSSEELQKRRATMTANDTAQGMYLGSIVGMVTQEFGPDIAARLRVERKLPPTIVPFFRYPAALLLDGADGAAALLVTRDRISFDDALVLVGKSLISTYFDSAVGRMMISLSGGNSHRILQVGPAAYKATYSFGERGYKQVSERQGIFTYSGDFLGPAISLGVIRSGLEIGVAVKAEVTVIPTPSFTEFSLDIKW